MFNEVMLKLASEVSDHNQIYNENDDTWYIKDDKCNCDYCIAYRVLFNIRQDIVEGK